MYFLNGIDFSVPSLAPLFSHRVREGCSELDRDADILGKLIRDIIYYPLYRLHGKAGKKSQVFKKLASEEAYYRRFWADEEPKDLNLECADLIRERYVVRDQPVIILEEGGKKITSVCRIIESKGCPDKGVFNALLLPGSLSTLKNNLLSFYDLLVAHSEKDLPGRFCIFGYYEMSIESGDKPASLYKPSNFEACGEVLKRTLETLQNRFGRFSLISAHSAGCLILAALLKRSCAELLPALLHFDRGASSIYQASRHYCFGGLLYAITKLNRMTIDVEKEIKSFIDRCSKKDPENLKKSACIVTGVEEDKVYPGSAGLATGNSLEENGKHLKFANWVFNPPEQIIHSRAHHSLRLKYFNKSYLTSSLGNVEMLAKENLAQAVLRLAHLNT